MNQIEMKIFTSGSEYMVIVDPSRNLCRWERTKGEYTFVDGIMKKKDAQSFISWIRSRTGGLPLSEVLEIFKCNNGRAVTDDITFEVLKP
mgnify:CR=1 FL=1